MLIVGSSSQSADDNKDNLSSPATIDQHHHHQHSDPLEARDHTQQQLLSELERFEVQLKQLAHLLSQTLNNHDQANSRQKLFNTISYAASHISFLAERCSNSRTLQASLGTSICVPNHLRPQQQQQTSSNVSNEGEQLKAMQAFQKQLLESSDGRISNGSDNLIAILPHLLRTRCLTELEQILAHSQASKVDFEQPKGNLK